MRYYTRRTLLSQCILLSLTALSAHAVAADCSTTATPTSTCGFQSTTYRGPNGTATWKVNDNGSAYINDADTNSTGNGNDAIYLWDNHQEDTQSLTVDGTNMSGTFIQSNYGGTKNITLQNGATTDMIEGGNNEPGDNGSVNIDINNASLTGENNSLTYGAATHATAGNKSYMNGAAIFVDSGENEGTNTVNIENGSTLGGDIYTVVGGGNNINVAGNSTVNGGIYAFTKSNNAISVDNSTVTVNETNATLQGYFEGAYAGNADADSVTSSLQGQTLAMGIYGEQASTVALTNGTTVNGSIAIVGNGSSTSSAQISLDSSTLNGNIITADESNTTVQLNNATVNGDITTGAGDDSVVLTNNSSVTGNVDAGEGTDELSMDANSTITGKISGFETINTTSDNNIDIDKLNDNTGWTIQNGSNLTADTTGSNVQVSMTSDSTVNFGNVTGTNNSLLVTQISPSTLNQKNVQIATFSTAGNPADAVEAQFSNGSQQVESRSGAYNYNDSLNIEQAAQLSKSAGLTATPSNYNVLLNSARGDLASDVQGAIAGLDAAKQAGRMVTDDLANRLDQVHLQSLYGHVADGAQLWGDFLYHHGDYSDDVDYQDITQGVQGGVDWTTHLDNGDSLTGGVALAWTRSRDQSNSGGADSFKDTVYGNYYSVYGGWQQALHDNLWGMFVDGSFSYGDMRYSMSAKNSKTDTSGMTQALSGSADGNLYTTQLRTGVNVMLPGETVLQPYATLGWDKADEKGFSDQQVTFSENQVSQWNTSLGMRVTTKLADLNKNVELYPWVDARYQTEFSDNTDFKAADYHNTDGHNTSMGIFGAGINTTIGNNFSLNTGVYFGTGDVDNDASVQAGISYQF
ncbi:autotransporter domain-containing protein [Leclercia adecarboxylata]|uniref:autotransporter domain-containing protein n=1 Tax=Leclercia adecarboxylata TaxID=83655 RepID=UPI002DBFC2F8|nr:autotransporter domain-containing protein [Leclercia adecarboxylata]MEB6377621.1 autotransporter domain-containing protein [Leclercia adecarboxylata]